MYVIYIYERNSGTGAIPGPRGWFFGPAHPGRPKPNLARSGQKQAGWKAIPTFCSPPEGMGKRAGVPVAISIFCRQHQLPVLPKRKYLTLISQLFWD
jgi:hypothetical protein